MNWIDAGSAETLCEGQSISVALGRCVVALVLSGGTLFAVEDVCTHDGAELIGGAVEGDEIVCPRHGARFNMKTGEALTPPAYEPLRVFKTKVADGRVWVCVD